MKYLSAPAIVLAVCVGVVSGFVGWDPPEPARAEPQAYTVSLLERQTKAAEAQAEAMRELVREVREAGRQCAK